MPDAGFDSGETYGGGQGAGGGVLGMLDVIKSDFIRTISKTEEAEAEAEQDHLKFMTETGSSLAEKEMAEEQKTKYKDDTVSKLEAADAEFNSQAKLRDTAMSYEERVARREQEIESLKKALCILESFAKYG